jgi:hypothetical protein
MKIQALGCLVAALLAGTASAFPAFSKSQDPKYAEFLKRAAEIRQGGEIYTKRATNDSGFGHRTLTALINPDSFQYNAEEQTVDLTSDDHTWIAPGPNDIRGPCPGLNLVSVTSIIVFRLPPDNILSLLFPFFL